MTKHINLHRNHGLNQSGYLKILNCKEGMNAYEDWVQEYELTLTNFEVKFMFRNMVLFWFGSARSDYNDFIKALLRGNVKEMNAYMNQILEPVFSFLDTGKKFRSRWAGAVLLWVCVWRKDGTDRVGMPCVADEKMAPNTEEDKVLANGLDASLAFDNQAHLQNIYHVKLRMSGKKPNVCSMTIAGSGSVIILQER